MVKGECSSCLDLVGGHDHDYRRRKSSGVRHGVLILDLASQRPLKVRGSASDDGAIGHDHPDRGLKRSARHKRLALS
jgi:hypothetical protein